MNLELTEIKRDVCVASGNESRPARTWSTGQRTSRTDKAMVGILCVDLVDAVFEEESLNFVEAASQLPLKVSPRTEPSVIAEGLASQLAVLERQCVNLRRMLEMAVEGA